MKLSRGFPNRTSGPAINGDMAVDPEFEKIVNLYYRNLYRFGLSLTRNEADASDLTQQTFYVWANKGYQVKNLANVKAWLFTTLHREFLQLRRRGSRFSDEPISEAMQGLPEISTDVVNRIDAHTMLQALGKIDRGYRAPLVLYYMEDLSYKQIADALEIPLGTVQSRIARGKTYLLQRMKTITSLAISSVLFLLSESLIAADRGGVGFPAPLQQSVNPVSSQPATATPAVSRTHRTKRGPHLRGGNGNVQPGNGNPAQGSQGPVAHGGPNHHPGQNGNQNPNQHHHQKPDNNPQKPPIASATPPPPRHDWHDGDWYRRHCRVIVIVVGSYYYWEAGYWYPAYGYDPTNYYPNDDPIYAYGNLLPDQVIANVQRQLNLYGYYTSAITGSLDSTTRVAIANYQRDNGLLVTGTVDQFTVESLGLI